MHFAIFSMIPLPRQLSIPLSARLSIGLSDSLSVHPSVRLSACPSISNPSCVSHSHTVTFLLCITLTPRRTSLRYNSLNYNTDIIGSDPFRNLTLSFSSASLPFYFSIGICFVFLTLCYAIHLFYNFLRFLSLYSFLLYFSPRLVSLACLYFPSHCQNRYKLVLISKPLPSSLVA